jgi:NAD(P)-dependent dehydrogenase (short-subunit alcohol dehydrogenase family)
MMRLLAEEVSPKDPNSVRKSFESGIAMNRYATNEEVAKFVVFLASDDSSYCTGGLFPIDGGFTAG